VKLHKNKIKLELFNEIYIQAIVYRNIFYNHIIVFYSIKEKYSMER